MLASGIASKVFFKAMQKGAWTDKPTPPPLQDDELAGS